MLVNIETTKDSVCFSISGESGEGSVTLIANESENKEE